MHYCVAAADDSDASGAPVHLLPVRRTRAVPSDRKAFELLPDDDAYKIREKEAKVQAKIVELNKLKAPKEPVVVDSTPIAVPIAEVPPPTQTMAVPVPPDASRSSFDGAKSIVAQPIATSATATAAIGFACEYATACAP